MPPLRHVLILVIIIAALVILVLYWRYRTKPATQWALRVSRRMADLRSRLDALVHPRGDQRSAAERLAEELFEVQKKAASVSLLSNYPKIGPKTVEWMESARIRTLKDAEEHVNAFLFFKKKIDNVGQVREEAIATATKQCLIDERKRFDSGASEQGQEFIRRVAAMSATERDQAAAKARERAALELCIDRTRELETLANQVTFLNSLLGQIHGVDDEVMSREFPQVEVAEAPIPTPQVESKPMPQKSAPSQPAPMNSAVAHLQACCRFALLAARADGRIANAERGRIRSMLGDQFGSDPLLLRHLDPQLEEAERNLPEEADALTAIKSLTPKAEWQALYRLAESVIDTGGDRNEKENAFLARAATAFEIDQSSASAATAPVPTAPPPEPAKPTAPDPLKVLDIPPKAEITADLVRRRYRVLTDQYDPEKAKLLGPEFAAMAESKRAAVKEAAEALMATLNEPLEAPAAPPPSKDLRHNPTLDDLFK